MDTIHCLAGLTYDDIPYFNYDGLNTLCKVVNVYDGDTLSIIFYPNNNGTPGVSPVKMRCRLGHIDTPEIRGGGISAKRARNRLIQLCTNYYIDIDDDTSSIQVNKQLNKYNTMVLPVHIHEFDKYGRLLVDIFTKEDTSIASILVSEGYGYVYEGGTKGQVPKV